MFAIHGLSGLNLRGPLEELAKASEIRRLRRSDTDNEPFLVAGDEVAERYRAATAAYKAALPESLDRGPVKHAWQVMSRRVVSVRPEDSIEKAWKVLVDSRVRQALVIDGEVAGAVVGLVSERDLLTAINLDSGRVRDVMAKEVRDLMTSPVVSADPVTDVRRIAQALLDYNLSGMPIVEASGRVVGFLSRGDILRSVIKDPPLSLWT